MRIKRDQKRRKKETTLVGIPDKSGQSEARRENVRRSEARRRKARQGKTYQDDPTRAKLIVRFNMGQKKGTGKEQHRTGQDGTGPDRTQQNITQQHNTTQPNKKDKTTRLARNKSERK